MRAIYFSIHGMVAVRLSSKKTHEYSECGKRQMTNLTKPSIEPLGWKKSFLWLALAVMSFHLAYTSLKFPAAGLLIFGYAFGLVKLADQPNVRRAFYFGLATGFLCYASQAWFLWNFFKAAAIVLWLVLAFWIGLFAAVVCGSLRRWGKVKTAWLIPIVWTGIEYFRSELYFLKFSWLNVGYTLPVQASGFGAIHLGMFGAGLVIFLAAALFPYKFVLRMNFLEWFLVAAIVVIILAVQFPAVMRAFRSRVNIVGVQMEFPSENVIPKILNKALARNTNAQIFVLSEYTLDGPVPDNLKNWCREHSRVLVVGGRQ